MSEPIPNNSISILYNGERCNEVIPMWSTNSRNKASSQHWKLSALLLGQVCGFYIMLKMQEMGPMVYYPYREGLNVLIIYRYHWKLRQHCILLSYFKTISVSVVWAQTPDLKHGSLEISNWANQAVVILLTRLIRHIQQLLELSTFWFCYSYFQKKFFFKMWTSFICEAGCGLSINFVV